MRINTVKKVVCLAIVTLTLLCVCEAKAQVKRIEMHIAGYLCGN
jgi:hypothetical protein